MLNFLNNIIFVPFLQAEPIVIIVQIIAVVINIICAKTKRPTLIHFLTFAFNALNLIVYILIMDLTATISYIGITIRSFLYWQHDRLRSNIWPWIFVGFHIVFGIITFDEPIQILTILAPCVVCIIMWYYSEDIQKLRIGNTINAILWLGYNIYTNMYIIAVQRFITIIANVWNICKSNVLKNINSNVI